MYCLHWDINLCFVCFSLIIVQGNFEKKNATLLCATSFFHPVFSSIPFLSFLFFFFKISLLGYLLVGSSPSPLITLCAFLLLVYIWIVYHLLHFFLSLLCLPFFRPQGSPPLRCLTSWSGWAWSPSRWSGCPSSTGWPQQNPQNTRPNATSANSVPSRASGRHGCVIGTGRLLVF